MDSKMIIRNETNLDLDVITKFTEVAFKFHDAFFAKE